MKTGLSNRCVWRGVGHPSDNERPLDDAAGGVAGITLDLQPPPRIRLFDQWPSHIT